METYGRDKTELERQDFMRSVRNNSEIRLKTLDQTRALDMTISYCLPKMKTERICNSELVTYSTVITLPVMQKSGTTCSRLETSHTVMNIPLLCVETHSLSYPHHLTIIAAKKRL